MDRKGIILAGGHGSRLYPLTKAISKQLIPVYDKPMIFYPLCTLMSMGIREILIICKEKDLSLFRRLLKDGNQFGIRIEFAIQKKPEGIAQALLIAEKFIKDSSIALILGDNLFYGSNIFSFFKSIQKGENNSFIFAYEIDKPERYGVVQFSNEMKVINIEEKPKIPKSKYAVTGIYLYENLAIDIAKHLKPSSRGELEISELNQNLVNLNKLDAKIFPKNFSWFDTGTHESLIEANIFIRNIQNSEKILFGSPELTAWEQKWISSSELSLLAKEYIGNDYGNYLEKIIFTK